MTDWKPEKNISSPWDVDVWENNTGQRTTEILCVGTRMTNQLWELHYQFWMVIGSIAERLFVRMK